MATKSVAIVGCECAICRQKIPFDMPKQLLSDVAEGKVVVFAGAGISTESSTVFPSSFYTDICRELGKDPATGPEFPDLMAEFCERPNGRSELLRRIKHRFDYAISFPSIYGMATRFHEELSTISQIDTVITTNWDDFIERVCGATPYVTAEDYAFWAMPGRKVFKIHGSINSLGSIVATRKDYEECYKSLSHGLLGSTLKVMLATKTIVYVGYSFRDDDIVRIHDILTAEMKGLRPHAYFVSPSGDLPEKLKGRSITPIKTDGAFFLSKLKDHLVHTGQLFEDISFSQAKKALLKARDVQSTITHRIDVRDHPLLLLSVHYLDGLIHGYERMLVRYKAGEYSPKDVHSRIHGYHKLLRAHHAGSDFSEAAYCEGYLNALVWLEAEDSIRRFVPLYHVYTLKNQPASAKDFIKVIKSESATNKAPVRYCRRIADQLKDAPRDVFPYHTPFIDLEPLDA
jgi:hypothetical protein